MKNYAHCKLTPFDPQSLLGKKIVEVDASSCNVLLVRFDDGTEIAVQGHHDFLGVDFVELVEIGEIHETV